MNSTAQAIPHAPERLLLRWYDRHRRDLPWRAPPGVRPDPYRVWLSEIMLQQTTVEAVKLRYERFLRLWPDIGVLAAADEEAVLDHWAGLGYYARARNLHACARAIVDTHGGRFPDTVEALKALPGIGDYTAAAIAAIAFGRPAAAVDGNAERVIGRLYALDRPPARAKAESRRLAGDLVPADRPGDFAQALMDLGATLCTPRRPACPRCPWRTICLAHRIGEEERFPPRPVKKRKPVRRALAFWLEAEGALLLRRRPRRGLLGGMLEIPTSPWLEAPAFDLDTAVRHAPVEADWHIASGGVEHVFTHFRLELSLAVGRLSVKPPVSGLWMPLEVALDALPTVMKKAVRFGRDAFARQALETG